MQARNHFKHYLSLGLGCLPFVIRLHTFREVSHFRMLVCGGDGTVGWVLGVLETIRHKLACPEPAIGIIPLGTGTHCRLYVYHQ